MTCSSTSPARTSATRCQAAHDQLLAGYAARCPRGWPSGPDDGYFYQHLAGHLAAAGRRDELTGLLTDVEWMRSRLRAGGVTGLLTDYTVVPDEPGLALVQATIRLSAHVLAVDPDQLPAQLAGRTIGRCEPELARLHAAARAWPHGAWLCPIRPTLAQPGETLRQTLTGHVGEVRAVAVSADGRTAVSGGDDGTVRVWDLAGTAAPRVLTGHDGAVCGGGGQRGRADRGQRRRRRHGAGVGPGRDRRAAGAHRPRRHGAGGGGQRGRADRGQRRRRRHGAGVGPGRDRRAAGAHRPRARCWRWRSARTGGPRSAAAGDGTVRVWDLAGTAAPRVLTGHDGLVGAVAVSADGRTAVSGGQSTARCGCGTWPGPPRRGCSPATTAGCARWRSARTGGPRSAAPSTARCGCGTWPGPPRRGCSPATTAGCGAVAVSADGRTAVSGGWTTRHGAGVGPGRDRRAAGAHRPRRPVGAVAVSADGRTAVSGGRDGTVRVWDLAGTAAPRVLTGHDGAVWGVAVSADGRTAVSGGRRRHGAGVGPGRDRRAAGAHRPRRHGVRRWRSARTGGPRSAAATTTRCGCGTWPGPPRRGCSPATTARWARWRSARTGGPRSAAATTARCGCGTWPGPPRRGCSPATTARCGAVAVSADGRTAVSGADDGTVRVWDLAGTAAPRVLTGHDGAVWAVAVSADGRTAVSGGRRRHGAGVGPGRRPGAGPLDSRRRCTGRRLQYRRHRCR